MVFVIGNGDRARRVGGLSCDPDCTLQTWHWKLNAGAGAGEARVSCPVMAGFLVRHGSLGHSPGRTGKRSAV